MMMLFSEANEISYMNLCMIRDSYWDTGQVLQTLRTYMYFDSCFYTLVYHVLNIGISYTLVVVFFLTKAVHNADLPTFSKIIFPYRYCIDDVKVLLANCWI